MKQRIAMFVSLTPPFMLFRVPSQRARGTRAISYGVHSTEPLAKFPADIKPKSRGTALSADF
jgi:hypothetical protein